MSFLSYFLYAFASCLSQLTLLSLRLLSETLREADPNFSLPSVRNGADLKNLNSLDGQLVDIKGLGNRSLLLFTSPILYGFSFNDKRWGEHFFLLSIMCID